MPYQKWEAQFVHTRLLSYHFNHSEANTMSSSEEEGGEESLQSHHNRRLLSRKIQPTLVIRS
jgi:hypothetical protein